MHLHTHTDLVELPAAEAARTGGGQSEPVTTGQTEPPGGGVITSIIRLLGAFGGGE